MQDCGIPSALAMEILQSFTNMSLGFTEWKAGSLKKKNQI